MGKLKNSILKVSALIILFAVAFNVPAAGFGPDELIDLEYFEQTGPSPIYYDNEFMRKSWNVRTKRIDSMSQLMSAFPRNPSWDSLEKLTELAAATEKLCDEEIALWEKAAYENPNKFTEFENNAKIAKAEKIRAKRVVMQQEANLMWTEKNLCAVVELSKEAAELYKQGGDMYNYLVDTRGVLYFQACCVGLKYDRNKTDENWLILKEHNLQTEVALRDLLIFCVNECSNPDSRYGVAVYNPAYPPSSSCFYCFNDPYHHYNIIDLKRQVISVKANITKMQNNIDFLRERLQKIADDIGCKYPKNYRSYGMGGYSTDLASITGRYDGDYEEMIQSGYSYEFADVYADQRINEKSRNYAYVYASFYTSPQEPAQRWQSDVLDVCAQEAQVASVYYLEGYAAACDIKVPEQRVHAFALEYEYLCLCDLGQDIQRDTAEYAVYALYIAYHPDRKGKPNEITEFHRIYDIALQKVGGSSDVNVLVRAMKEVLEGGL